MATLPMQPLEPRLLPARSPAFSRSSMSASTAVSMRLTKKLATLATRLGIAALAAKASSPAMYASATAS